MTKTIAINAGSSSLKWQLYLMPEEKVLAKGLIERIGLKDSISTVQFDGRSEKQILDIENHTQAVKILLDDLIRFDIIKAYDEITGVGHRVVAGGEYFKESTVVEGDVLEKVEELSLLAPLHNPANAAGVRAFKELLPDITSVVVFDTSFHTTMPEKAYRYPLPTKYYTENKVRKYGAHGTSHQFVAGEAAKLLGRPLEDLKLITCHIGNGASVSAQISGKPVETSMGLTPLEGLMMGSRTGDIDPAAVFHLIRNAGMNVDELDTLFNKKSGLMGMTGHGDMREVLALRDGGDETAALAIDMYVHRIVGYIGNYTAQMGGLDVITFTAGVGENSDPIRAMVCEKLAPFGVKIDAEKNETRSSEPRVISTPDSSVTVCVIPTNEELAIAQKVAQLAVEGDAYGNKFNA